jgi:integrase
MNIATKVKPPKYVFMRGKTYYYIRNIANRHQHRFDNQKQIWVSLKTGDYAEAVRLAGILTREHDSIIIGDTRHSSGVTSAEEIAQAELLRITPASSTTFRLESIERSIQLLVERMPLVGLMTNPSKLDVAALAGVSEEVSLTMDAAFRRYLEITPEFAMDMRGWDAEQKIKKYQRSVADFVARVGNIDVLSFDDEKASKYLLSIKTDVVAKKFKSEHANRVISNVRVILREVLQHDHQKKFSSLDGKRIKIDDAAKRPSFTEAEVRAIADALPTSDISDEAKAIIKLGLITGCGVKELCWLTADDIKPDAKTPHIRIGENALRSRVKTGGDRHRDLPIVTAEGVEILKAYRNGFPRFQDDRGPTKLNKVFGPFFKRVTPGKTFYSARHRMDDLLKISRADLGIKASISGHSLGGHLHYYGQSGNAYTLNHKKEALLEALAAAPVKEEQENENN